MPGNEPTIDHRLGAFILLACRRPDDLNVGFRKPRCAEPPCYRLRRRSRTNARLRRLDLDQFLKNLTGERPAGSRDRPGARSGPPSSRCTSPKTRLRIVLDRDARSWADRVPSVREYTNSPSERATRLCCPSRCCGVGGGSRERAIGISVLLCRVVVVRVLPETRRGELFVVEWRAQNARR